MVSVRSGPGDPPGRQRAYRMLARARRIAGLPVTAGHSRQRNGTERLRLGSRPGVGVLGEAVRRLDLGFVAGTAAAVREGGGR